MNLLPRSRISAALVALALVAGCRSEPAATEAPAGSPDLAMPEAPDNAPPADHPPDPAEPQPGGEPTSDPAPTEPAAVEPVAPAGFERFTHEAGRFSVEAPGVPQLADTTAETAVGPLTYTNAMFRLPDGALMVAWGDLPIELEEGDPIDDMFNGGRDGMIKSINGTLLSEKVIELDGRPGREWIIAINGPPEVGKIINHTRSYLDGSRNYILQGMRLESAAATKAEHFLASFRITAPAP